MTGRWYVTVWRQGNLPVRFSYTAGQPGDEVCAQWSPHDGLRGGTLRVAGADDERTRQTYEHLEQAVAAGKLSILQPWRISIGGSTIGGVIGPMAKRPAAAWVAAWVAAA